AASGLFVLRVGSPARDGHAPKHPVCKPSVLAAQAGAPIAVPPREVRLLVYTNTQCEQSRYHPERYPPAPSPTRSANRAEIARRGIRRRPHQHAVRTEPIPPRGVAARRPHHHAARTDQIPPGGVPARAPTPAQSRT